MASIIVREATNPMTVDFALHYCGKGWAVLPLHSVTSDGACTCGRADCKSPGKHPLTRNGLNDATTDEATIVQWWNQFPLANIGIATGEKSGFVVLDIDGPEGEKSLSEIEAKFGPLPETLISTTGRGRHLLFKCPTIPVKSRAGIWNAGSKLDSRGNGGYIVVALLTCTQN